MHLWLDVLNLYRKPSISLRTPSGMSKRHSDSRSPTPTPTNPSPTSRRNVEEKNSPQNTQSSGLRDDPSGPHSILPKVEFPNVNLPHTRPIRPIESSIPDQRMAKRIRTSNVTSEPDRPSGSLQCQQDNIASSSTSSNTLMEPGVLSNMAGETLPSKKKRTRTLTTPYQAAVLHSLLAQVCVHQDECMYHFFTPNANSLAFQPLQNVRKLVA